MNKRFKNKKYVQGAKEATHTVLHIIKKQHRQIVRLSVVSTALTVMSLAIVGLKILHPFHVFLGVGLYLLSYIPFLYSLYISRATWRKYHVYKITTEFAAKERRRICIGFLVLILIAVFIWLRPLDQQPFTGLSDQQIINLVKDDMYRSVTAMDYLETTGNDLLSVLAEGRFDTNHTEDITIAFTAFIDAIAYSESLTDVHRYFATIPYRQWDTRLESFLIANSLYTKKYELVHRIMLEVGGSEHNSKALNQYISEVGRDNIYNSMLARYYQSKTRVRLTGGHLYQTVFIGSTINNNPSSDLLRGKSVASYQYLRRNFGKSITHAPQVLGDLTEAKMYEAWFPIQKGVATAMGRTILSTRGKAGLITEPQALVMEQSMRPGDIMLQRRNWHLSNVGIPGFWTHSALYTGDLDAMDEYFASEFPYEGFASMSDYMREVTPLAYAAYLNTKGDHVPSVIEAIEPGVVAQTLPVSADADFVAVLRPNLSITDSMLALMKAFSHTGKAYDFNFDFDTRDTLVCSELIYDAFYERLPEKNGLQMETSVVSGRKIVSPFDIATKYVTERNTPDAELEFIYFLRSSETTDQAFIADEAAFVESINWSKFSFIEPE